MPDRPAPTIRTSKCSPAVVRMRIAKLTGARQAGRGVLQLWHTNGKTTRGHMETWDAITSGRNVRQFLRSPAG